MKKNTNTTSFKTLNQSEMPGYCNDGNVKIII
jgi:hypothetical protein